MQLISRIIYSGNLNSIIEWGITSQDFLTPEGRAMFNHILGYHSRNDTAGSVLGPQAMGATYPTFMQCDDPGMSIPALCLEVRKERLAIEGMNQLDEIREMFLADPLEAINLMSSSASALLNVGVGRNTDMFFGAGLDSIIMKYEMIRDGIDMSAGPWPWQVMNDVTGGIKEDDYVVFYGRPKSFKSWVLAYLIADCFNSGKRAVIYTKEMTQENIFMRVAACVAGINYQAFRLGILSPDEESALYSARSFMNAMQASQNLICLSGQDAPEGGDTVPWLQSKVEKYRPHRVFVDGMYLMSDVKQAKKENQVVKNISRALRQMVLYTKIPLFATLQANRAAAKNEDANLDEIAFSDAIGQDATCIARIINEKDSPTCQIVFGGAREYALNGFRINANPCYDFSYFGPLTSKEIDKAKENDTKPEEDPNAHAKRKRQPATTTAEVNTGLKKRFQGMS
jgi:hypothetical protein